MTRASASAKQEREYMLQSDQFSMGLASNLDRQNKTVLAIVIGVLVSKVINLVLSRVHMESISIRSSLRV